MPSLSAFSRYQETSSRCTRGHSILLSIAYRTEDGFKQSGENRKPAVKLSSTPLQRRANDKWRRRSRIGSSSVVPLGWYSGLRKETSSNGLDSSALPHISRRKRTRYGTSLPSRPPDRRQCRRWNGAWRSAAPGHAHTRWLGKRQGRRA